MANGGKSRSLADRPSRIVTARRLQTGRARLPGCNAPEWQNCRAGFVDNSEQALDPIGYQITSMMEGAGSAAPEPTSGNPPPHCGQDGTNDEKDAWFIG
jgi:hypothetical protein